jgi:hypothetical protein
VCAGQQTFRALWMSCTVAMRTHAELERLAKSGTRLPPTGQSETKAVMEKSAGGWAGAVDTRRAANTSTDTRMRNKRHNVPRTTPNSTDLCSIYGCNVSYTLALDRG